jgi:Flp pilus assembly protein TadD
MIEVRLERRDSSLVANAYTRGSNEFSFAFDLFDPADNYSLVIREPGYKELHFPLEPGSFHREIITPTRSIYTYGGIALLELESLPKEEVSQELLKGPRVVDIRQLEAQIPEEARQEFDLAKRDFAGGNSGSALTHLEKAVELAPKYYDAVNMLGAEYLKAGQYEKAEPMLNQAHALNPNDPSTLTNLGTLYFQEGERLESAAGNADAGIKQGEASYRKAVEMLEKALQLDPRGPRANYYLGTVLYKVGDYERAESMLINALALDNHLQDAHLSLLNIYIRQKRYGAALEQISAYLEANPNAPQREQIENLRIQIESALNQEAK